MSNKVDVQLGLRLRKMDQRHPLNENYFNLVNPEDRKESSSRRESMEEKSQISQTSNSEKRGATVMSIHDPMKRSKQQFDYKFDKIFPSNSTNAEIYVE